MPQQTGLHESERCFRLVLSAELSEVSKIRRLIDETGGLLGLTEERLFDLKVAVCEAAANAIEHASSIVEVTLRVLGDRLIAEVGNDGVFRPDMAKSDPSRPRGLGLPLIVALADEVNISRSSSDRTQVSLTFFRPASLAVHPEEERPKRRVRSEGGLSSISPVRLLGRRGSWWVLAAWTPVQVAIFVIVSLLGSPSRFLGIPGAATALVGVLAAIGGGTVIGVSVSLVGGLAYLVFLADFGRAITWPAIVVSIVLWAVAALAAGLAGERVRQNASRRESLLARMLTEREALSESLGVANARLVTHTKELDERNRELQLVQAETERLLQEQSTLFQLLQGTLIDIPKEVPGVEFSHLYRSATARAQVGGDFYDVFQTKAGQIGVLIGDVSGHGVEAARIATMVKDSIHAFAHELPRPHSVLQASNGLLVHKGAPGFVTAFFGLLDPSGGTFVYSCAGHPSPLLLARDRQTSLMECVGLPLGVFVDASYKDVKTDILKGSRILFYTDGIIEAHRHGDMFGEERLAESLRRSGDGQLATVPSQLIDDALAFSDGVLVDDVALLVVDYTGVEGGG